MNRSAIFAWCLYDWACASFSIVVTTFIFATYFTTKIAPNPILGTYLWANAISIAGIVIALLSPLFGAIADHGGSHKLWLFFFTYLSVISIGFLWFAYPSLHYIYLTLFLVAFATVGYEIAQVFYNTFLTQLAPREYIGRISGWGWGSGYFGGIAALSIALFVFVRPHYSWLNMANAEQIRICGPFVALWYGLFALPIFFLVPALNVKKHNLSYAVRTGCKKLIDTIKKLPSQKNIMVYLIAHMIYTDGLNTLFAFGGIYAAGTFGLSFEEVLVFGITMNIAAGIGAVSLCWLDDYVGPKPTLLISLVSLTLIGIPLVLLKSKLIFWITALLLCLFVGPVQSASRSLMVRLISKNISGEMFGLYALSGKISAFMGPWALGLMTYHFSSQRFGVASILFFFLAGAILLLFVRVEHPLNLE